jgi:MerR family transcriptional regulator, light-induced transcriptional regulator
VCFSANIPGIMGQYSIKELETLSGIKAHTIRIWEKRYSLIQPKRTDTNIRFYSDDDLKKIINVSVLNNHGIKISKIAGMPYDEINRKMLEVSASETHVSTYIDQLIISMVDMEEERFQKTLNTLVKKIGFERAITEAVYPFLEKIGVLWLTQNINPAQEHFISNLIRQKIIAAIDELPLPKDNAPKILLFLPEHELHELGLLFYCYIVKQANYKVYYLGQNVPEKDLDSIIEIHRPEIIVTSITNPMPNGALPYITQLSNKFPRHRILVSGIQLANVSAKALKNVTLFSNALKFKELISNTSH